MMLVLILALFGASLAKESYLKAVLRSPKETLKLYDNFKAEQHLAFDRMEDRLRFRLFRKNAEMVADENSIDEETAEFALNFFSTMTESEQISYRGLNVTGHNKNAIPALRSSEEDEEDVPKSKLWTNEGKVTAVDNQGSCGSCWTWGAVGGLETRYAEMSGVLRKFAEQEYLDCVYEGSRDGCNGGWPDDCYTYSEDNGGRLASTADYPYTQRDGSCQGSSKPDAMIAAKIRGVVSVGRSEQANIEALASGSLSVAFEVTNYFQSYSKGILKDTTCTGRPNHAVTAVGYTEKYVLVKNSWGKYWGDQGYVKFARNHHNCNLWDYSSYPELASTGASDNGGNDKATDYKADDDSGPTPEPTPEPDCVDFYERCDEAWCWHGSWYVDDLCPKTCKKCEDSEDKCPSGTTMCDDGVCRHEHMC